MRDIHDDRRRWGRVALRVVSLLLLGGVLFYAGRNLYRDIRVQPWRELRIRPVFLGGALASLLLARLMNAMNVRQILAALGSDLPGRSVYPVIWVASLGRYLPGKVAVVAGSTVMLVRLGARVPAVMAALFLSTALMILMGMLSSTPLLFMPAVREVLPSAPVFSVLILGVGVVCLYPPIFLSLCNVALRKMKKEPLPTKMRRGVFWMAVLFTLMRSGFLGLGLWLAAKALAPVGIGAYPLALASAGLASVIGFVAVFSPAGLGVHEEVYRNTMRMAVGGAVAWLVVLFRILHVVADLVMGAVGMGMMRMWGMREADMNVYLTKGRQECLPH